MRRISFILLLIVGVANADESPLFVSEDPIDITIKLPLQTIIRKAEDRPVVDATATYETGAGQPVSLPVQISTRGKSRLRECQFPPLSFQVTKKNSAGTIFEGQKSLKLVAHCRSSAMFRSYVLQELGIYRAFNVLTDVSFRARQLNIRYEDTEKSGRILEEMGFFIEPIREVASRNGLQRQKVATTSISQHDPAYAALTSMFQFLIGNTDWSVVKAPPGDNCCHNGRVLSAPDASDGWLVVPYDFDQTGIINARYAAPVPQLGIRSVRQRLWRGRCVHNDQLDAVIEKFNEQREALELALMPDGMKDEKSAQRYIDAFYDIINDSKRLNKQILEKCLAG